MFGWKNSPQFIYFPDGYFCCFQIGPIMNKAPINQSYTNLFEDNDFISPSKFLEMKLLVHRAGAHITMRNYTHFS